MLFASCALEELELPGDNYQPLSTTEGIHIIGTAQDFDAKKVTTRAEGDDLPADSYISEMTMFIFDKNGKLVQGYTDRVINDVDDNGLPTSVTLDDDDKCSSAINIKKANPTFLIDTKDGIIASLDDASPLVIYYDNLTTADNDLTSCSIYIVANAWHVLEGQVSQITKLADLENVVLDIDETLSMPKKADGHYIGFPMIGTHADQTFDLTKAGTNKGAVAKIPLKKLYSKVQFTIQVNADQVVSTPKFKIQKVEVFNVPKKARLGRKIVAGKPSYGNNSDDDYIVELAGKGAYTPSDYYQSFVIEEGFSRTEIMHTASKKLNPGSEYLIEFGFYMPEHKLTPNKNRDTYSYPAGIPEDLKQYYKPELVGTVRNEDGTTTHGQLATFVRLHGEYTDHNGQIKTVRYDVYLGQNNTDDFTIKRNQLLTNKLVITGLTNYYDAYSDVQGNISIDHRVDVDYKGFSLSMERTAILDSHFEVRPLDVELSPNSTMKITIPEDYRSWIAMESDARARETKDADTYINTSDERKGVRKYFTTNLVKELNDANGGTITLFHNGSGTKIFRIWFYIDENPNVYDKLLGAEGGITSSPSDGSYTVYGKNEQNAMYRNCPVKFSYFGTDDENIGGNPGTVTKTVNVNFQQWNLWRVWNYDEDPEKNRVRYYDIEHEEEYLNNYASDVLYGQTQDGMPFGLENIQLSGKVMAYWKEPANGLLASIINAIFGTDAMANNVFQKSGKSPYYDFYLSRDNFPTDKLDDNVDKTQFARNYMGKTFNQEIAAKLKSSTDPKAKIDGVILTEDPLSAFSYCYNKNKRNDKGVVETLNWFLPAIDEIEDIALGAYDEFDQVFQNKAYWSCQPAYEYNDLQIKGKNYVILGYIDLSTLNGEFYSDNTSRARATSIYSSGGNNYSNIESGLPNDVKSGKLAVTAYSGGSKNGQAETTYTSNNINYNSAIYQEPNGEYRGNKKRTDICRIRAVYRSGTK